MPSLREQAIAPDQYDNLAMDWAAEGGIDTPVRLFMREYLEPALAAIMPNSVLDVGCGTGWLSQVASKYGTRRYLGIDPSANNVTHAQELYPGVDVRRASIESFVAAEQFDFIACVMATEHIDSIDAAFYKWKGFLNKDGRIAIIAGDVEAFSKPRFDYRLHVEPVDSEEFVVETIRPNDPASTTDIIRSVKRFEASAALSKLTMISHVVMPASDTFIAKAPKYELFRENPLFQLMIFGPEQM